MAKAQRSLALCYARFVLQKAIHISVGFLSFFILLGGISEQSKHVSIRFLGSTGYKNSVNPGMGDKQRKHLFEDRVESSTSSFTIAG